MAGFFSYVRVEALAKVLRCCMTYLLLLSFSLSSVSVSAADKAADKSDKSPDNKSDNSSSNSGRIESRYDSFEIRVIRPRYFSKRGRFELGAELSSIMNESFIYTFMASGMATYHFTEAIGLELMGAYGFSIDKEDKRVLKSDFQIDTELMRTQYIFGASILYTPIYGKFQLPSGRLIYFDNFITIGAGETGIYYKYDHCISPDQITNPTIRANTPNPPDPMTKGYVTMIYGVGQRYFIDKNNSIRWDLRGQSFSYDVRDNSCNPAATDSQTKTHTDVTMQLGVSHFF